ncbi:MAG: hypothetical protein HC851_15390 [Acaryochloris sp. RU_4_1]|nr:hypothetical protein [Acaryochloris sp. RU_4_1]NJR57272.1 hypothetical protein [Acaryochloris sp. CRU_2_0]
MIKRWLNALTKRIKFLHLAIALVFLLQGAVLAKVTRPPVGDYEVFHQVYGIRSGAAPTEPDPEKTKEKIGLFAANLVRSGFDWQPQQIATEEGIQYPKNFHAASFYFDLESDLRQKWLLSRISRYQKAKFPFERFLTGSYLSSVELSAPPQVKQISKNRWQAEVRAVRVVIESGQDRKGAAFKERLGFVFGIEQVTPRLGHEWGLEKQTSDKC